MARTKQTARLTPKELAELEAERKRVYRARVVQQPKKAKRVKKAKTMKKAKKPKTVEVNSFSFYFRLYSFSQKKKNLLFHLYYRNILSEKVGQRYFLESLYKPKQGNI